MYGVTIGKTHTCDFFLMKHQLKISFMNSVDGKWGSWGRWSNCDKSCGGGKMKRERKCDKPKPTYGGKSCSGSDTEEKTCNTKACVGMYIPVSDTKLFQFYMLDISPKQHLKLW